MAYRARTGGVMGSGLYPQANTGVDVGSAIEGIANALANTKESMIRRAMMKRDIERQDQASQLAAEDRRIAMEDRTYNRTRQEAQDAQSSQAHDLTMAKTASDIQATRAEQGITPDTYAPAPGTDLVKGFQPPTIRSAYESGGGTVGQFQAPLPQAPSVGTLPSMQLVGGSTDYTQGTKYKEKQAAREQAKTDAIAVHEANHAFDVANPAPSPDRFSVTSGLGPDGKPVIVRVNTHTGEVTPTDVGKQAGGSGGGRGSATIQKAVANNTQQIAVIDDAIKELEKAPSSVGLLRGLPYIGDKMDQRIDPKGVAARASIANIGSLQIHDRTGAAMTAKEEPRLAPFVPNVGDTPAAIKIKLKKLRANILLETSVLQHGAAPSGTAAPSGPTPEQQLYDAAVAKHGKAKVMAEYGARP